LISFSGESEGLFVRQAIQNFSLDVLRVTELLFFSSVQLQFLIYLTVDPMITLRISIEHILLANHLKLLWFYQPPFGVVRIYSVDNIGIVSMQNLFNCTQGKYESKFSNVSLP